MTTQPNLSLLDEILARGLCHGAGRSADGEVCLEQAVALCYGLPLTDAPDSCVHPVVSAFGRRLNDASWSSAKARADGLRDLALAQLGTAKTLDRKKFITKLAELTIRRVLPMALRARGFAKEAERCEREGTRESALAARTADAAAYAVATTADAADAAATAAAYAAAAYAADADAAAAYAAAYAAAADARRDEVLRVAAACAVEAIGFAKEVL